MIAFVDETGNEGIDLMKQGNTEYYVMAVITADDVVVPDLISHFQTVKSDCFKSPEMKSSIIRADDARRADVLEQLMNTSIEFFVTGIAVDKAALRGDGFRYPRTFIKHMYGVLYQHLHHEHDVISVFADKIKGASFQADFERYLDRADLFVRANQQFNFVDSSQEVGVQAADVIAGSLARVAFNMIGDDRVRKKISDCFSPRLQYFRWYPRRPDRFQKSIESTSRKTAQDLGLAIEQMAVRLAQQYIDEFRGEPDTLRTLRVEFLEILMARFMFDSKEWVPINEILPILKKIDPKINDRNMRQQIVGPLRSRNLIISSRSGAGGYKLPSDRADIEAFLDNLNEKIMPMLKRLGAARKSIQNATAQDIFDFKINYRGLQAALDSISKWDLG